MMRRKSVGMLLCVVMLFGVVAMPQVAGAAERSEEAGSFSSAELAQYAQMQAEKGTIIRVLKEVRGNKRKCSKILKIDYTTLFDKIKKYSIEKEMYPDKE